MKNIFLKSTLFSLVFLFFACSDTDVITDQVFEDTTTGGILRTLESTTDLPIGLADTGVELLLEVQDEEDGDLSDFIEVYASFRHITGGGANDRDEVLLKTVPNSEWTYGERLPRALVTATLPELQAALSLGDDDFTGGDRFIIRVELVFKDGRRFSDYNSSATVLGNLFFASPFVYNANVTCVVPEESFLGSYTVTAAGPGVNGLQVWEVGTVVTLVAEGGPTRRSFDIQHIPSAGVGQDPTTFAFDLVCGNVNIAANQSTGLQCTSGLFYGPAPSGNTGSYNAGDDSSITFIFTDNAEGDCDEAPQNVTATLTKN
ncbi:hypothetical protein [Planktosalinus lacus]|uniref:Lipoprotein n=1 Tax=Planktosalinus lacus TaxID=1526573 RepID=A0A8J2V932_9FLAO|nr:hypothetical protein [Planktosalinus lacus]GGD88032.1 hypothetical protein GCM10011312_10000 [Planktosalinus lacus]